MQYMEQAIDGALYQVLNVLILDENDRNELSRHTHCRHVQVELCGLEYLSWFPVVETLIITGGIPTGEGFEALYRHKELKRLVLDYEETDSDEEGIALERFPQLEYVLSRSNLNIRGYDPQSIGTVRAEVKNLYRDGKLIRLALGDSVKLLQKGSFLFLSWITSGAAGFLLRNILNPVQKEFTDRYFGVPFSQRIDSIAIIPICKEDSFQEDPPVERRLISWKRRGADLRLQIPYKEFVAATPRKRIEMVEKNISDAAVYVRGKDKTFEADRFLEAVREVFRAVHGSKGDEQ